LATRDGGGFNPRQDLYFIGKVEVYAVNNLKTAVWMLILTVLLVLVGRWVAGDTGMVAAFALAVAINAIAYWFSDRIALSMARAEEVSPAEAPRLHEMAERLASQYGVPKPRVYLSPDPTPNAFATGRNPRHAAIAVNQGLLHLLDRDEVFGVLAHEFGHVRNRDILISSVAAVMAGAITLISNLGQWSLWFGDDRDEQERGAGPLGILALLLSVILAPLAATVIQLAISRSREYQADATAATATGNPEALASALTKLEEYTRAAPSPLAKPAFAHLYIVNPLSGRTLAGLFSTHPPIEERVRRLRMMVGRVMVAR
jgi:heat shock protein HtpX